MRAEEIESLGLTVGASSDAGRSSGSCGMVLVRLSVECRDWCLAAICREIVGRYRGV